MILKYYLKQTFFTVFSKRNIFKFLFILTIQILIQTFFILNLFEKDKVIDSALLAFSTDSNTPFRLFSNIPRAVVFDKKSEFSNTGVSYYSGIKSYHNLTNLQFFIANISEIDKVFIKNFDEELKNITVPSTLFNS